MKRFKFKFDVVGRVRKTFEDEALRGFADTQREFREEVEKRNMMVMMLEKSLERREKLATKPVGCGMFIVEDDFINGSKIRIMWQDRVIERVQRKLADAHRKYIHARQQRMIIDKLREKAYVRFKKAHTKRELKKMDELYVIRSKISKEVV